ncbi:MAG: putative bifunctional diguanylate cyclase/phosphodiesterase [Thermoanaerobaculaceae bacterium]
MPGGSLFVFSTYLLQAALAVALALVLLLFHRRYRRDYLWHWAWSWWALASYLVTGAASLALAPDLPASHPLRASLSSVSLACSYLQVGWLLAGAWELSRGVPTTRRRLHAGLVLAAFAGALSSALFAGAAASGAQRFFVRVGVRSLLTAVGFAVAAWVIWRFSHPEGTLGRAILCGGLAAYAGLQAQYFAAAALQLRGPSAFPRYSVYLGFVEAFLLALVALAITIWLLEEEQLRAIAAHRELERLTFHDPLTGLANRRLLEDRLAQALTTARRGGESLAVILLDLDRLSAVSDSLGFGAGDELVRDAAQRLLGTVPEGASVARVVGGQFALVLPGATDDERLSPQLDRLLGAFTEPFELRRHDVYTTASIGVAVFPRDGEDDETLLRHAGAALAQAQADGPGTWQRWAGQADSPPAARLALEARLRQALPANELLLHYQPVVSLATGEIEALEALLRWRHPELGVLPPAAFLELADSLGLLDEFDLWAVRTACQEVGQLRDDGITDLRVAVNLSARTFQHPRLVAALTGALLESGLAAETLELEVTEAVAMQNVESTRKALRTLKGVGIRVAIDDFGTGYSSLSYLRSFAIDTLKIDQSFTRDLGRSTEAASLTAAIVALGHSLGLTVVAEGVETEEQRQVLRRQRCDLMQGYLFSRPAPLDTCRELLLANRAQLRLHAV